jgi:ribose 5-phosphate isomerase A
MDPDFAVLAARALELVPDGGRIGLGSGRTADAFLEGLAERVRGGFRVRGVPTSEETARRARQLGISLDSLEPDGYLDVTIDGADEVEPASLNLIKGWGGALVRERIVAAASRRQVILVTGEKIVQRLGSRGRLPVEVLPFAAPFCRRRIEAIGQPRGIRTDIRSAGGKTFVSDNGNWILDCAVPPLESPVELDRQLRAIPGVIDVGLFLGTADLVLIAEGGAVKELRRPI